MRLFPRLIVALLLLSIFGFIPISAVGNLRIVDTYGQIRVNGNKIVSENGDTIALRGMSLFWSQWAPGFYNYNCIKWLRDDWKCMVVRAAMAVDQEGYLTNPTAELNKIKVVVDACLDLGIYVIVDWHSHHAENELQQSKKFFTDIATLYGKKPNLIYEIYNEPMQVSWTAVVKPYADSVIAAIRKIDNDNIIIVGTPTWSQDVNLAAEKPILDKNVAYGLHFYAGTHKGWLRDRAAQALMAGIALWVTEFGTCNSDGKGQLDYNETQLWFNFMQKHKLSWCNWALNDKEETASVLLKGASKDGGWPLSSISESGILIRSELFDWYNSGYTSNEKTEIVDGSKFIGAVHNYPNPFKSTTTLSFVLDKPQDVQIDIFSVSGSRVDGFNHQASQPGMQTLNCNFAHLSSGIYYIRYKTSDFSFTSKFDKAD